MIVTAHAVTRFIERIAPHMTADEARAAIGASERAVSVAAEFGCTRVVRSDGAVLRLQGETVATVVTGKRKVRRFGWKMGDEG